MNKVYFPREWIELQREIITYHKDLHSMLQITKPDIPETIAIIGAYVGVIIDGYFTEKELIALCYKLTSHLVINRPGIQTIH